MVNKEECNHEIGIAGGKAYCKKCGLEIDTSPKEEVRKVVVEFAIDKSFDDPVYGTVIKLQDLSNLSNNKENKNNE